MFRPSQSLLFRPMPILKKLKIHHPLPLSPRESKQLLNLLTASFRQQLDTEHPQFRTDGNANVLHEHLSTRRSRRSSFSEDKTPTARHMHSLLTNPLFNISPGKKNSNVVFSRDPMDIFSQAVAKGMMTTSHAKACLTAKKAQIVRSSVLNVRDGMKDSGAGLKVLKWLVSSGTTNNTEFLKDDAFVKIMMEYMVAEGLQEAAWKWVKTSLENLPKLCLLSGEDFARAQKEVVGPLMLLVRAEAADSGSPTSLDAAYMAMSRAAGYLGGLSTPEVTTVLGPPGWFLIRASVMPKSSRPPPSENAFESFLSLIPVITKSPARYFAHLSLLHPTNPNPDLALDHIRSVASKSRQKKSSLSKPARESDHHNIQLGLDAANFLLQYHRYTEADEVMEFLRSRYPKQLGIKEMRQLEQAKAEASSLELLERLGLT
ncbi:hypothetical protein ONS95_004889 [Cadophora gregata]|uniref:uncharacterized protein n=1 Tax=Cadophora gregata TaxID=51156 RepID=UPI0026DC1944|nr:uncharacterized protein ONS95_004889 [Cadophora gregata]KAK0104603.1 hypothetical protein ONS95_004889 [Cadophora gregata]KAK0115310.1 hypothetical protein ONS96_013769 [Cadophora gregata f. sp. sojae]